MSEVHGYCRAMNTQSVRCRGTGNSGKTGRCIVMIPASKPSGLCYFCERTAR